MRQTGAAQHDLAGQAARAKRKTAAGFDDLGCRRIRGARWGENGRMTDHGHHDRSRGAVIHQAASPGAEERIAALERRVDALELAPIRELLTRPGLWGRIAALFG